MTQHRPIVATTQSPALVQRYRRIGWQGRWLTSNRYVLGMALFLGLVVPEALHRSLSGFGVWFQLHRSEVWLEPSLLYAGAAIAIGHYVLQNTSMLPLVSTRSIIAPTFISTFGVLLVFLFTLELSFGRYHLWTGFLIAMAWYYVVAMLRGLYLRPVIGMIGITDEDLRRLPRSIVWTRLTTPRLPRHVAAVAIDPHASLELEWAKLVTRLVLHGIPVYHLYHLEEGLTGKVYFSSHADNTFGALLPSLFYFRMKRLVDVTIALLLLPAIALIIGVASLAIRLDSPGRALFVQRRMGYRGRQFSCYKLRTMRTDIEGPAFTLESDPRITRLGAFLRKWRIDELPQVINIIRGEMSWIGPRPEASPLAKRYSQHVPFYDYRHAVRPGISGWAAVHQGNVADIDAAAEKLAYDFYYIKYFSFWLDFLIVVKTIRTIWTGFGSR